LPFRLACLTAHPDDESGAFGAALLMAARRGIQTSVLCLTEGAAGSYREPGQTDEELARERRQEFAAAGEALQVSDACLLEYPDGQLWQEPFLPLVERFVLYLRKFRPHVVLTFGPEGGVNLHRDHTMVSLAATAAFEWAGRESFFSPQLEGPEALIPWAAQKLYYSAPLFLSTPDAMSQQTAARVPASLIYELNEELFEAKMAAFAVHASQKGVMERVKSEQSEQEEVLRREAYLLVASRTPRGPESAAERDIWDGVTEA
jgi:LmbE family N-acetylglucosaminyl deacetylase